MDYANGALDFFPISGSVTAYARAADLPDTDLRSSVAPDMRHINLNGADGAILADRELRVAIQKGVDRQAIAGQPHLPGRPADLPGQRPGRGPRPGGG